MLISYAYLCYMSIYFFIISIENYSEYSTTPQVNLYQFSDFFYAKQALIQIHLMLIFINQPSIRQYYRSLIQIHLMLRFIKLFLYYFYIQIHLHATLYPRRNPTFSSSSIPHYRYNNNSKSIRGSVFHSYSLKSSPHTFEGLHKYVRQLFCSTKNCTLFQ